MKKLSVAIMGLCLIASSPAFATNWKKEYCGNQDYIPAGHKYPHLHCGKDFYTYSKSSSNHTNMVNGDQVFCGKVATTLENIIALPPPTDGKAAMQASVQSVSDDHCAR